MQRLARPYPLARCTDRVIIRYQEFFWKPAVLSRISLESSPLEISDPPPTIYFFFAQYLSSRVRSFLHYRIDHTSSIPNDNNKPSVWCYRTEIAQAHCVDGQLFDQPSSWLVGWSEEPPKATSDFRSRIIRIHNARRRI
jgi:hypothetical protein